MDHGGDEKTMDIFMCTYWQTFVEFGSQRHLCCSMFSPICYCSMVMKQKLMECMEVISVLCELGGVPTNVVTRQIEVIECFVTLLCEQTSKCHMLRKQRCICSSGRNNGWREFAYYRCFASTATESHDLLLVMQAAKH